MLSLRCDSLILFQDGNKKLFLQFNCYDNINDCKITIINLVEEQIKSIYKDTIINSKFIQRLAYKMQLTIKLKGAILNFKDDNGILILATSLSDIYDPVLLTKDGTKIGDPTVVNGKITKLFSKDKKIFMECLIDELNLETNTFFENTIIISIDKDVKNVYKNKLFREKVKDTSDTTVKGKNAFVNCLSEYLEGENVQIEFDEYKGYSLWTCLEDLLEE